MIETALVIGRLFSSYNLTDLIPEVCRLVIDLRNNKNSNWLDYYVYKGWRIIPTITQIISTIEIKAIIRKLWSLHDMPAIIGHKPMTIVGKNAVMLSECRAYPPMVESVVIGIYATKEQKGYKFNIRLVFGDGSSKPLLAKLAIPFIKM